MGGKSGYIVGDVDDVVGTARRGASAVIVDYAFGADGSWSVTVVAPDGSTWARFRTGDGPTAVREAARLAVELARCWGPLEMDHRLEGDPRAFHAVAWCEGWMHLVARCVVPERPQPSNAGHAEGTVERVAPETRAGRRSNIGARQAAEVSPPHA